MKKSNPAESIPRGKAPQSESDMVQSLVRAVVPTRGFKKIVHSAAPEIASQWAGNNPFKKFIAAIIVRSLQKSFAPRHEDPPFDAGIIGSLVANGARAVNEAHAADPVYFSEQLRGSVRSFIEGADFGEIKEAVDGSMEDMTALVKIINEELWRYPAKFICLLSLAPAAVNMTAAALKETLAPVNSMAPDLLVDVLLSLIKEINGKNIGGLVNELSELVRKIHTGSALLGEPGKPQFPAVVSRLTEETLSAIDIKLLLKARSLLAEIKEISIQSLISLLETSPELAREFFQGHFVSMIAFVRVWSRKAHAFERVFSDDDLAREFAGGMGALDAQEIADTVSRLCGMVNRVQSITPGVIRNTLTQTIRSLDTFEVGETVRLLAEDVVESLKPVASEILPPVIRGLADLLRPAPDGGSREVQDAVDYFKNSLNSKEAVI